MGKNKRIDKEIISEDIFQSKFYEEETLGITIESQQQRYTILPSEEKEYEDSKKIQFFKKLFSKKEKEEKPKEPEKEVIQFDVFEDKFDEKEYYQTKEESKTEQEVSYEPAKEEIKLEPEEQEVSYEPVEEEIPGYDEHVYEEELEEDLVLDEEKEEKEAISFDAFESEKEQGDLEEENLKPEHDDLLLQANRIQVLRKSPFLYEIDEKLNIKYLEEFLVTKDETESTFGSILRIREEIKPKQKRIRSIIKKWHKDFQSETKELYETNKKTIKNKPVYKALNYRFYQILIIVSAIIFTGIFYSPHSRIMNDFGRYRFGAYLQKTLGNLFFEAPFFRILAIIVIVLGIISLFYLFVYNAIFVSERTKQRDDLISLRVFKNKINNKHNHKFRKVNSYYKKQIKNEAKIEKVAIENLILTKYKISTFASYGKKIVEKEEKLKKTHWIFVIIKHGLFWAIAGGAVLLFIAIIIQMIAN
ncbi:MAG TPA: hypothetical protein PKH00_00170 [Bacilli bacterium]|jgi:hypothetical protein|nr:hypothetical protein [Bacilli bacterium]HNZ73808.1 hypothetical protein [Bacilli bacterium]HQO93836.1 hypothetical protein [Bacilli bacterium]HQQ39127.1 hypothetical protein [Bacilli bacterium]